MKQRNVLRFVVVATISAVALYFLLRNRPPEPMHDWVEVTEGATIEVDVLANDTDPDHDVLIVATVGQPANGVATVSSDGRTVEYTPQRGFYGEDRFTYRVTDPDSAGAESSVEVAVTFSPPSFHQRSRSASLSEMLQEPPTSVYGSTIDVFLYADDDGNLREITIAGHADSLTCGATSGAFAGALIDARDGPENFVIAGAGRMSVPLIDENRRTALLETVEVTEYKSLDATLSLYRLFVRSGNLPLEKAEANLEMTFEEAQAELNRMSKQPLVAEYLRLERPRESALTFVRQARELQKISGMLRLHYNSYALIADVIKRIREAAVEGGSTVLEFADLLTEPNAEAVVYVPMLGMGNAEEVVLRIPVSEFSPEGFQEASRQHRSAMEGAIVGSAERRLAHAEKFIASSERDASDCRQMDAEELARFVPGLNTCDRDGCRRDLSGLQITYETYCEQHVPSNIEVGKSWKAEAERVLARVRELRARQDEDQIDVLAHAAVVDSMLRDWALPIPNAQAAFDFWREHGRLAAWRALTDELTRQGIGRAALSGESVVFNVRLSSDFLVIRPLLVVDVRRTRVVLDSALGVTAAVAPWELRRETTPETTTSTGISALAELMDAPHAFALRAAVTPEATMTELIDELNHLLPEGGDDWARRVEEARNTSARIYEDAIGTVVADAVADKLSSSEDAFRQLLKLQSVAYVARNESGLSAGFVLNLANAIARGVLVLRGERATQSWRALQSLVTEVPSGPLTQGIRGSEETLFGMTGAELVDALVVRARALDAEFAAGALAAATSPPPSTRTNTIVSQTVLTRIVDAVESARSAMTVRSMLETAIDEFAEDGTARFSELDKVLVTTPEIDVIRHGRDIANLQLSLRYFRNTTNGAKIGPIEGNQMLSEMVALKAKLDSELREIEPLLSSLRFGRDQEVIVARLQFDQGNYAAALDRLASDRVSIATYAPGLTWMPIDATARGVPELVKLRAEGGRVIVSAVIDGESRDLLRLDGLDAEEASGLVGSSPSPVAPWNEGDPLWEQVLLAQVPANARQQSAREALLSDEVRLPALKALVYACAAPGRRILEQGGRCKPVKGSTALHDRVRDGGVEFTTPEASAMRVLARERFQAPAAWKADAIFDLTE